MDGERTNNPWVRAEQHLYSDETLQLFPPDEQEVYEQIIAEIGRTGAELNQALGAVALATAAHQYALNKRDTFFRGQVHGSA